MNDERELIVSNVKGDGNCLFRALSLHVYGNDSLESHMQVRKEVSEFLEVNYLKFDKQNLKIHLEEKGFKGP